MKTRIGLVSNSSSSSFIIIFPHAPQSAEDVYKFMFNCIPGIIKSPYHDDVKHSHEEISNDVYKQLEEKNGKVATKAELREEFEAIIHHKMYDVERIVKHSVGRCGNTHIDMEVMMRVIQEFGNADLIDIETELSKLKNQYDEKHDEIWKKYEWSHDGDYNKRPKEMIDEELELNKWNMEHLEPLWKKRDRIHSDKVDEMVQEFIKNHEGWWYNIVSYADENSQFGSFMEHSNIFRNVVHQTISHH